MLQLLPVYFPLFGTPVLKPDLHLKQRYTRDIDTKNIHIRTVNKIWSEIANDDALHAYLWAFVINLDFVNFSR